MYKNRRAGALRKSLLLSIPVWAFAVAGAHAACAPAAPASGATVTCTGNEPNGFVAPVGATDLTVNIQQNATITGSQATGGTTVNNRQWSSVLVRDGSTVNNDGSITVTQPKLRDNVAVTFLGSDITLNNNNAITLTAPAGNNNRLYGVFTSVPDGSPAGTEFDDLRIVNNGSISVTMNGNGIARGIYGGEDIGELTVVNNGTITATRGATSTTLTNAVAAIDSDDDVEEYTINNTANGRITATGAATRAINGRAVQFTINNFGTISGATANGANQPVSAAINTYTGTALNPYNTTLNNYGTINGDVRNTDSDNQTTASPGLAIAPSGNGFINQRRNGTINNFSTINGNLFFGSGNQQVLNVGAINGGITFLDAATTAARAGSVNGVTLTAGSTLTGNILARGAGDNTLTLTGTYVAGGGDGGGGGDDDDDDDRVAPRAAAAAATGDGLLTSNVAGFTRLIQTGGTWTLAAGSTQTFSESATVDGGTLIVDSTLRAPNVLVEEAGTLGGSGTIFGNLFNEGVVSPGSAATPYGTLTLNGSYIQDSAGRFSVTGTADGTQNSRLAVSGVASLDGDLQFRAGAGQYRPGTTYTVITAAGGVEGEFATTSQTGLPTLLRPTASYDDNNAYVTITQGSFTQVARTNNERAAATGFDALLAGRTDALTFLDYQSDSALANILDRAAGQGYASLADPQFRSGRAFTDSLMGRAYLGVFEAGATGFNLPPATWAADLPKRGPVPEPRFVEATRGYGVWATGYGQTGSVSGTVGTSSRNETIAGFAAGIDMHPSAGTFLGIAAGYGSVDVNLKQTGERAHTDNAQVGIYGGIANGPLYAIGTVGYAHAEGRLNRSLAGLQVLQPGGARGAVSGDQFLSAGEAGYRYAYAPDQVFAPFVGFQVSTFSQDRVSEANAGLFDLNVAAKDFLSARTQVGARFEHFADFGGHGVTFAFKAAYVHDFADVSRTIQSSFVLAPTVPFTVEGRQLSRDRALVGVGIGAALAPGWTGFVNYDAEIATSDTIQAGRAGARYSF